MIRRYIFAIILVCLNVSIHAKNNQLPLEYFNHMPMVEQPSMSPDGKHVAVISNQGDNTLVVITKFNDVKAVTPILQLGADKHRIESLSWANDKRVLVTVTQPVKIFGLQYRSTHLFSASIDGKDVFEIRKRLPRNATRVDAYYNSPRLLSLLHDEPNHILVTINAKRDNNYVSVFKVDVRDGSFEKYLPNSKRIVSWTVTETGEILLAVGVDNNPKSNKSYIYTRKNSSDDWQMVKTVESYKSETFSPVLYENEKNTIIVISDHKLYKDAMWRFDIEKGEFTELLAEAPGDLDIVGAITRLEGKLRKVIGFTYNDNFIKRVYFDGNQSNLSEQIRNIFAKSGLQSSLYDWDSKKEHYIISTISDSKPAKFYLFDKTIMNIKPWYGQYPNLERQTLANVLPFDYQARDGMELHGYLTLPNNVENPPIVLFPHGGPFSRDSQYFDAFVQLFASRGYAVLQVNFRGSTGYGNKYQTSGYRQWGKKMQTDLIDALDWVQEQGLADTKKACIVGASYGGYAALVAGYQTPDKFKCIVSIAGVSDLSNQIKYWKRRGFDSYINNAVSNSPDELIKYSPIHHVNEYKAPVLLIHGKVDTRVQHLQSKDMFEALTKAGKKVDYQLFNYGTHHLNDATNRKKAMELIDQFLDKNLK